MNADMILIVPLAFACEFIDSSLGMGYGTSLTPILLLLGFEPLQVVPAVLLSEFVTGLTAAVCHHKANNVDFNRASRDTKVAIVLSAFSVIGTVGAVFLAIRLPADVLKIVIGAIVLSMGAFILATLRRTPRFAWRKISVVATVASFNKGLSGGGYGPLVMGGQMLSGIGVKNAIAITSLAEGVTCLAGIIIYLVFSKHMDWTLALALLLGAVLSVPFAAITIKRISERKIKIIVAVVILLLGVLTLAKVLAP